ncbi:hypothetical protein E2C01_091847 [Portunus trituberculatus]|uniref:Uncharacterized protein n=1 Tax=Portunus trituberculatus TaxID=210409 RepID=A0A5B7JF12_PORTR|nr:hypothetical protein [Portunus trituberculatus]
MCLYIIFCVCCICVRSGHTRGCVVLPPGAVKAWNIQTHTQKNENIILQLEVPLSAGQATPSRGSGEHPHIISQHCCHLALSKPRHSEVPRRKFVYYFARRAPSGAGEAAGPGVSVRYRRITVILVIVLSYGPPDLGQVRGGQGGSGGRGRLIGLVVPAASGPRQTDSPSPVSSCLLPPASRSSHEKTEEADTSPVSCCQQPTFPSGSADPCAQRGGISPKLSILCCLLDTLRGRICHLWRAASVE